MNNKAALVGVALGVAGGALALYLSRTRSSQEAHSNADPNSIRLVFRGNLVHCLNTSEEGFQVIEDCLIGVRGDGTIAFVENGQKQAQLSQQYGFRESSIVSLGKRFLLPGLVDTHLHAPQYPNAGTGTDLPLLKWLERYTFPMESKFTDLDFAQEAFTKAVKRVLSHGTTTGCYFSTIHLEATKKLVQVIGKLGQRAFVGKVCMDRNSPEFYVEKTPASLKDTEDFIQYVLREVKNPLITPVITPRFVPTCTGELMKGLGKLASDYKVPIQSHVSENKGEVAWVKELHPEILSYTGVYDHFGLMNERTIMAHGIYLSDEELQLFKARNAGISHCPVSNFTIHSGILDVRRVLKAGVKIGLGTDISGGHSPSVWEAIRQAVIASNTLQFNDESYKPISFKEAFALATIGGAEVLGLQDTIGNFVPGKAFDALVIDPFADSSPFDVFSNDTFMDVFQKFVFLGNYKNIESVFVNGRKVQL